MKAKIKIKDNSELRNAIDELYESMNQIGAAKWSVAVAKHLLKTLGIDYEIIEEIKQGFTINELWQAKAARGHDVRQAGFKIHKIARECDNEIRKTALRAVGHAVGSGHMKEHAMVASDYAIKAIGLATANDMEAITLERQWQLKEIKKLSNCCFVIQKNDCKIKIGFPLFFYAF